MICSNNIYDARWYILFSSLLYSPKLLADLFYAEENVNMLLASSPPDDVYRVHYTI